LTITRQERNGRLFMGATGEKRALERNKSPQFER